MGAPPRDDRTVEWMSFLYRVQHALMAVTLLVLAITGFALMYHQNWLGQAVIRMEGGVLNRGILHRCAAVFLLAQMIYHFYYMLFSREGRHELSHLALRRQDFSEFAQAIRYGLGTADAYPRFGRYGYKEKFQYWGTTAGIVCLALTGFMLWGETWAMLLAPKFILDLVLVIHGYQGLLAFVLLLFWHLYIVHLHPSVFPMNNAWITGKVRVEWLKEEHPLEYDRLKEKGAL